MTSNSHMWVPVTGCNCSEISPLGRNCFSTENGNSRGSDLESEKMTFIKVKRTQNYWSHEELLPQRDLDYPCSWQIGTDCVFDRDTKCADAVTTCAFKPKLGMLPSKDISVERGGNIKVHHAPCMQTQNAWLERTMRGESLVTFCWLDVCVFNTSCGTLILCILNHQTEGNASCSSGGELFSHCALI